MQARALREGSLGLVILLGIATFGGLFLWLRGVRFGESGFTFAIKFSDASGLDIGSSVRFRGVPVGKVQKLEVENDGAIVTVAIANPKIIIPRESIVETTQGGFISSTVIDILPQTDLQSDPSFNPLGENCDAKLVVCNGNKIDGTVGVSFTRLLRQTSATLRQVNETKLIASLGNTLKSTTEAAQSIKKLSDRFTTVVSGVDRQLDQFGDTASELKRAAASVGRTAVSIDRTASTAETFLTTNRTALAKTLESISNTSKEAQSLLASAKPLLDNGEFVGNLQKLSENAAETAANLRQLSKDVNNPETLASLRATLDSARATFANAQKISADLDELTGDPKFRANIRNLVNGLSGLVSSGVGTNIPVIVPANTDPATVAKAKSSNQDGGGTHTAGNRLKENPLE